MGDMKEMSKVVEDFGALSDCQSPIYLAIGVFDGVHLGHAAVITSAVDSAKQSGGVAAVLTFAPHPSRLFRPEEPTLLLMPMKQKIELLHGLGIDCVIRKTFDREYASIPADEFLSSLKSQIPTLAAVYVGENFRFGKKRSGNVATLIKTGEALDIAVFSANRINYNGEPISSTRIRKLLTSGKIAQVNQLLGHNYTIEGIVAKGKQLGRTLNFPTLNILWSPECRPCFGVYVVRVRKRGSEIWQDAIANYGLRPTVETGSVRPLLETHVLDDTVDMSYEDSVEVQLLSFVREERAFSGIDALKRQIAEDVEQAKRWFVDHG